jgi:Protein kinase domain/PEGA domain
VGVGVLGPVFRTYEPARDRLAAVKVFRLDLTPEQARALADELERLVDAGLGHPSIVAPLAAGVEGSTAYLASEYVAGEALDIAIRHYAPASLDKALPFIAQLAGALDFARTAGVGHGTLHPRDIFLTPDEARATGFGVANALEAVGLRAPVRRPYSAPERVEGGQWGSAADVFALGAIAWELLTGRRITGAASGSQRPGDDRGAPAGVRRLLAGPLARALAEDPSVRYPNALAFARALEAAADGEEERDIQADAPVAPAKRERAARIQPSLVDAIEDDAIEADANDADANDADAHEEVSAAAVAKPVVPVEPVKPVESAKVAAPVEIGPVELETEEPVERFAESAYAADTADADMDRIDRLDGYEPADVQLEPVPTATSGPVLFTEEHPSMPVHAATVDRPRPSALPFALVLVAGLLVGFVAGYAVGTRGQSNGDPAPSTSEQVPTAAADPAPGGGQAYSEEKVAEAPPAPAARAEPPAAAMRGTIVVRSTPANAGVIVDGEWRGRSPLTLEDVPLGKHTIRIVHQGYVAQNTSVALSSGDSLGEVNVSLAREASRPSRSSTRQPSRSRPRSPSPPPSKPAATPAPTSALTGALYVDSRPRGARIYVDGRAVGTTPMQLSKIDIGSHVVRLELAGHQTWTSAARVVAGSTAKVTGSLEPVP